MFETTNRCIVIYQLITGTAPNIVPKGWMHETRENPPDFSGKHDQHAAWFRGQLVAQLVTHTHILIHRYEIVTGRNQEQEQEQEQEQTQQQQEQEPQEEPT